MQRSEGKITAYKASAFALRMRDLESCVRGRFVRMKYRISPYVSLIDEKRVLTTCIYGYYIYSIFEQAILRSMYVVM